MATSPARALLALALVFGTPLALAQAPDTTTRTVVDHDRDFDFSWLGLLGLIGLAGLRRKEDHRGPLRPNEPVR